MNFFNEVKDLATGSYATNFIQGSGGAVVGANVVEAARKAISYLTNSLNKLNSFISIMSSADWMVTDASIGMSETVHNTIDFNDSENADTEQLINCFASDLIAWFRQFGNITVDADDVFESDTYVKLTDDSIIKLVCTANYDEDRELTYFALLSEWNDSVTRGVTRAGSHQNFLVELAVGQYCWFSNVVKSITGTIYNIWDVMKTAIGNCSIMEMALTVLQAIVQNSLASIADITGMLIQYTMSTTAEVISFANEIISVIRSGGLYSGVMFLLNLFKLQSTCVYNDDGTMSFTDNTGLVPQSYTFGLFTFSGQLLSSAAGIIAAAGHWIISGISFLLSTTFQFIGKLFDIDPSDTHASLVHFGKNLVNLAPLAIGQRVGNTTETTAYLTVASENSTFHESMSVPGGTIFLGKNSEGKVIYEFHPDMHDRRLFVSEIFNLSISGTTLMSASVKPALISSIDSFMEKASLYDDTLIGGTIRNDSSGHLTSSGDLEAISVMNYNMLLYIIYCDLILKNGGHDLTSINIEYGEHGVISVTNISGSNPMSAVSISADEDTFDATIRNQAVSAIMASGVLYATLAYTNVTGSNSGDWFLVANFTNLANWVVTIQEAYFTDIVAPSGLLRLQPGSTGFRLQWVLKQDVRYFYDTLEELPSEVQYCIDLPKYDANSFWANVIIGAVLTVAVTVVAVVTALHIRKVLNRARFKRAAAIERAHTAAVKKPTKANIDAYSKVAWKNNVFSSVFGGTKYSRSGMWGDAPESGSIVASVYEKAKSVTTGVAGLTQSVFSNESSVSDLAELIRG